MKNRIWELDALRGICVLGMVFFHCMYDMMVLYRLFSWDPPEIFYVIQYLGGALFVVISGICVTLGSRGIRRGLIVLGCGLVVSAVTYGMYWLGFSGSSVLIKFGVLHCLGICMLLWPLIKKVPAPVLVSLAAVMIAGGLYLQDHTIVDVPYFVIFGFTYPGFSSADYFPLLPYMGYFLLGAALGRTVYKNKQTLFPSVRPENPVVRFLSFFGKWSLPIYMLHQPVLNGILTLYTSLTK